MVNYRQKIILILSLLIFLIFPKPIMAEWIKDQNPVFSGTNGTWDAQSTLEAMIIYEQGIYKTWYTGNNGSGWRIGYATSFDGKTSWEKRDQPVIQRGSEDNWEMDTSNCSVIHNENGYEMWYSSINWSWGSGPDRYRLRYASSSNGINWTNNNNWILKGTERSWDSGGSNRGITVIKTSNGYKLWYTGIDNGPTDGTGVWQIGYAESPDGIAWTKRPEPVITPKAPEQRSVSYPKVILDNGKYRMWYKAHNTTKYDEFWYAESTDGINWTNPPDKNPVFSTGGPIGNPFVMKMGNTLKMWYDCHSDGQWRICYAENDDDISPPPIHPVILIPGHGASFNRDALIYNQPVEQKDWKLTPFVQTYDGIINTFKNDLLYPDNKFYVFNYDWRKKVTDITADLENFLTHTVQPENSDLTDFKVKMVGHSLGGLVARSYGQEHGLTKIEKLVSVGSPQKGTLQAYKAWEAGEIDDRKGWQWLALELLLQINKRGFNTDMATVRTIAPGTKDLLPTFNYLKINTSPFSEIDVNSLHQQNDWLKGISIPSSDFFNLFTAIYGQKGNTPEYYRVENQNLIDKVLGKWEDGKPVNTEFGNGDYTILSKSAYFTEDSAEQLNLDHGELIEKAEGIQKILEKLDVPYSNVSEAPSTVYNPSLLFLLLSPAKMDVKKPNNEHILSNEDKIIFIENALEGNYEIKVIGEKDGRYRLIVGQLTNNGDFWNEYEGITTLNREEIYKIVFNKDSPLGNPLIDSDGKNYLQQAKENLLQVKKSCNGNFVDQAIKDIDNTFNYLNHHQLIKALISLQKSLANIFKARKKMNDTFCRNLSFEAAQNLALSYQTIFNQTGQKINKKALQKIILATEKLLNITREKLNKQIAKNKASKNQVISFTLAEENFKKAKEEFNKNNYPYCQILLEITNLLLSEVF